MPHGILGGHTATHPQQIAGVSSLLELVNSIININSRWEDIRLGVTEKKGKRYVDYAPLAAAPLKPW